MQYALEFEEGPGYILVHDIQSGKHGAVQVVRSVVDDQLYIRKFSTNSRPLLIDGLPNEVRFSAPHNLPRCYFPELISWEIYDRPTKTYSMILKRYNGGDLNQLARKYQKAERKVPETFIWHYLRSISYAIGFLQLGYTEGGSIQQDWDPIMNRDHAGDNVFVHYPEDCLNKETVDAFPDIILGDFGLGSRVSDTEWCDGALSDGHAVDIRETWEDIQGTGTVLDGLIGINDLAEYEEEFEEMSRPYSPHLIRWMKALRYQYIEDDAPEPPKGYPTARTLIEELIPLADRKLAEFKDTGRVPESVRWTQTAQDDTPLWIRDRNDLVPDKRYKPWLWRTRPWHLVRARGCANNYERLNEQPEWSIHSPTPPSSPPSLSSIHDSDEADIEDEDEDEDEDSDDDEEEEEEEEGGGGNLAPSITETTSKKRSRSNDKDDGAEPAPKKTLKSA